jgi:[acyl-carrier-protein] S-malonyltransferase
MAAILGLEDDQVREACRQATESFAGAAPAVAGVAEVVEPANFNAPAQVVIAGSKAAVERACEAAKAMGAKRALPLAVSAPFHSSLLRPAGDRLALELGRLPIAPPRMPLVNNVDVQVRSEPAEIMDALVRQSFGPVRWVEVVRKLRAMGVTHLVEFGPGKVLTGLAKRIDPDLKASAVYDAPSLEATLKELG